MKEHESLELDTEREAYTLWNAVRSVLCFRLLIQKDVKKASIFSKKKKEEEEKKMKTVDKSKHYFL